MGRQSSCATMIYQTMNNIDHMVELRDGPVKRRGVFQILAPEMTQAASKEAF